MLQMPIIYNAAVFTVPFQNVTEMFTSFFSECELIFDALVRHSRSVENVKVLPNFNNQGTDKEYYEFFGKET
jgi:hypothetical protein